MVHDTGVAFTPHAIGKDLIVAGLITIAIVGCAVIFGPAGPSGPPDPTLIRTAPKPDAGPEPAFRNLRSTARFAQLLAKIGPPQALGHTFGTRSN